VLEPGRPLHAGHDTQTDPKTRNEGADAATPSIPFRS
jgi:hypothetical protein